MREHTITSSQGDKTYTVKRGAEDYHCNCKGYRMRRNCKHIQYVKAQEGAK